MKKANDFSIRSTLKRSVLIYLFIIILVFSAFFAQYIYDFFNPKPKNLISSALPSATPFPTNVNINDVPIVEKFVPEISHEIENKLTDDTKLKKEEEVEKKEKEKQFVEQLRLDSEQKELEKKNKAINVKKNEEKENMDKINKEKKAKLAEAEKAKASKKAEEKEKAKEKEEVEKAYKDKIEKIKKEHLAKEKEAEVEMERIAKTKARNDAKKQAEADRQAQIVADELEATKLRTYNKNIFDLVVTKVKNDIVSTNIYKSIRPCTGKITISPLGKMTYSISSKTGLPEIDEQIIKFLNEEARKKFPPHTFKESSFNFVIEF